ncbi:sigma-54-dependent Fis family transcriptional regulator [Cumulibacter soli]|uniref:sigma-54-dependent Fis family transcriptional regulator n=1 Tax=Cumulibacter soli TaxID=2546344 RepID=UPI001ABA2E98|nr:helix-turn-helix domain-containing protein [Cumulibacter soli]
MAERDVLRAVKVDLASAGLLSRGPRTGAVPDPIERSWRRSISLGVSPGRADLAEPADAELDDELIRAARPVLNRLARDVADMCVGVVLSDVDGVIIDRYIFNAPQRSYLDRLGVLVGSDFAERTVGTNGLGSVVEERAPIFVRGAEHFIEALEEVACAGVPIFDPSTRRVRGSVSLTCTAAIANPLMLTLAHTAARDIEQRLMDGRSRGLMDIASAFARATSRGNAAVALLTPNTVLANTAGLSYVSPANHAVIWDRLVRERVEHLALMRLELLEGEVDVRAQRVHVSDEDVAFEVSFAPARPRPSQRGLRSSWHSLASVHAELRAVVRASAVVALAGAPGVGRAYVARRVLGNAGFDELDIAVSHGPRAAPWSEVAFAAVVAGRQLLLRNVDGLGAPELPRLGALLEAADDSAGGPARVVLTFDPERASDELLALVRSAASLVRLPELSQMRSVVPVLAHHFLAQYAPEQRCKLSAAAMQALAQRSWPSNIRELRQVIHDLVVRHPGEVVRASDIPDDDEPTGRRLSPIEYAERKVIVAALRESQGNRAEAARILGIGRTTLYRKLRLLRIDDDELSV